MKAWRGVAVEASGVWMADRTLWCVRPGLPPPIHHRRGLGDGEADRTVAARRPRLCVRDHALRAVRSRLWRKHLAPSRRERPTRRAVATPDCPPWGSVFLWSAGRSSRYSGSSPYCD